MSTGGQRPRLNLRGAAPPVAVKPAPAVPSVDDPAPVDADAPTTTWVRPAATTAPSTSPPVETGVFRRSPAPKANRTVSVPARLAQELRERATRDRWSITDAVFVAVERYRYRLRAAPAPIGREPGPKPAPEARAHLVLYLADEEWNAWRESALVGGLRTPSKLVSEALHAELTTESAGSE